MPKRPASEPTGPSPRLIRTLARLPEALRPIPRGSLRFGKALTVDRYLLPNGLMVLACEDHSAPVVSYHTWLRVGSRHERPGKTGLAHLFEHLMFGETKNLAAGEYDRRLEEAGAETNASTWLDFTQYSVNAPARALPLVIELESERLGNLVLDDEKVRTEKEVVANERRYRVDDDIDGTISELLWSTAFTEHAYRAPTIGWLEDIQGLTPEDCSAFHRAFYAPNNAIVVVVGDFDSSNLLERLATSYGALSRSQLPLEDVHPEPPQMDERIRELKKPTPTEKLVMGWRGPALGDSDHAAATVLCEILCGGRASRLVERLVHDLELASDVRLFLGPFRDPGLIELSVTARNHHTAEELLAVVDSEIHRIAEEPVTTEELTRSLSRLELGLLSGLESADGRCSMLGFYETVLYRPAAAIERLDLMQQLTASDVLRAARYYLSPRCRSQIRLRPSDSGEGSSS
jgi:zinc protease